MNYIVYDLEATCWEHSPPEMEMEIIEIGAYRLNEFGEVRGKFNRFVKPVLHPSLSDYCRDLTTIEQIDINRAKNFPDVIEEFWKWGKVFDEPYLLCSWGNFDKKMLVKDCKLHRLEHDWAEEHINLKSQYKDLNKLRDGIGMMRAMEREHLHFTGVQHRGISDAENLVKIFQQYLGLWRL